MGQNIFSDEDLGQISIHGLSKKEVLRQLDLFEMSAPYLKLVRPCTKKDGIKVIDPDQMQSLIDAYELDIPRLRCLKFVPASGAASRMFKFLQEELNNGDDILKGPVEKEVLAGQKDRQELLTFMDGILEFSFFEDLKSVMSDEDLRIDMLLQEGRFIDIIRVLLSESGLNYAGLPKGLLKFHEYKEGSRTSFEEHLVETSSYVADVDGNCHLHFTVSPEHMEKFESLLESVRPQYEEACQVSFHVSFSVQKESTDTIAVDLNNHPFRDENDRLLFRPGGHGALIENVNDLKGDIVFIKNIDNVVPDRLRLETYKWKKIIGGCLISLQKRIFGYLEKLSSGIVDEAFLREVENFMREELSLESHKFSDSASSEEKRKYFMERLNRPIRICGMVKNEGEPGGGPFWVQDSSGDISPQIVESAQIDPGSKEQLSILASSTHFNPVDLVCGVSDWQGRPFDLHQYVDEKAIFISQKSKDGKDLKALEHPGLWNGAMARWITLFVEVPIITFNPVKTVNDLLREEHQPGK